MKKTILTITGLALIAVLTGCRAGEETGQMSLFDGKKSVGTDIGINEITDFYYTEENINYDAFYQRYRFYVEDGKYLFFHDTRRRENEYGPCTEEDRVLYGTLELTDDQWSAFADLLTGGIVKARGEDVSSGDSGPWMYLYWTGDKGKDQEYSFASYDRQTRFTDFCEALAKGGNSGKKEASLSFESFDGGGPEFHVVIRDEGILSYSSRTKYDKPDHERMNGAGYDEIITFTGISPGETTVIIEERSPIADNLDHKYRATVDEELNVQIELLSVKDIYEGEEESMILKIDGEAYPVEWEDNESVEALKELCPLTVQMSMYGGFEQVGSLGSSLPKEDEQTTTDYGDIVLYSGDRIVIFYGSNSWAYTRLGHILADREIMEEALGNGDVTIELVN